MQDESWPDGWKWYQPVGKHAFDDWQELDLLAEATRRAVDLRDRLAEAGETKAQGGHRAAMQLSVLRVLWRQALERHLGDDIDEQEIVHTRPWELVERLREDGRLP